MVRAPREFLWIKSKPALFYNFLTKLNKSEISFKKFVVDRDRFNLKKISLPDHLHYHTSVPGSVKFAKKDRLPGSKSQTTIFDGDLN